MTDFLHKFSCQYNEEYSIVIEDDELVSYAYLFKGEIIVGDIWLYNQAPTPVNTIWKEEDMPFLNPFEFVKLNIQPITDKNGISLKWVLKSNMEVDYVLIKIRKELIAKLSEGANPGWSTCVAKDGPLARVLGLRGSAN
jgi:hypothetical protein